MDYQQQHSHQFLHSSVIPRLTSTPAPRKPRPVSEATSISSSVVEYECESGAHGRVNKAPVYNYSRYDDMDLAEDAYAEEESGDDEFEDLYSKTKKMNSWLTGGERNSVGSDGTKTASSCDEVRTPTTPPVDYTAREMGMADSRPIMGPRGPHLFRSLSSSSAADFQPNEELVQMSPIKIHPSPKRSYSSDLALHASAAPYQNKHLELDLKERPMSVISTALEETNIEEVENWSTADVCAWLMSLGFDDSLIEKFRQNDISGAILMELQWEDLKELDIQSFGKKVELMSELNHLRKSPNLGGTSPGRDGGFGDAPKIGHTPPLLSRQASKKSRESNLSRSTSLHSSPTVRQSTDSMAGPLSVRIPGNEGVQMVASPTKGRGLALAKLTIPVEEPESEIEDSASEDYEDVSSTNSGSPRSFTMEPEVLQVARNQSLRTRRRRSRLSIQVPGGVVGQPAGSAKSAGARSTCSKASSIKGDKAHPQGFAASRLSKRKVRMSIASIPSTPLSPTPRMVEIFATTSVAGSIIAGRRASMQVPDSPRWAPSVCASSDVLGPKAKNDVQLKADELRKVAMVSAHEQVNKFLTLQHLQNLEERVQSPPGTGKTEHFPDFASQSVMSPRNIPLPLSPSPEQQRAMSMAVNMGFGNAQNRPGVRRSQSLNHQQRPVPAPIHLAPGNMVPGQVTAGFVRPGTSEDDLQPYASPRAFDPAPTLITRSATTKTQTPSIHSQLSRAQTVGAKATKRAASTKSSTKPPSAKQVAPSIASSKTSLSGGAKSHMKTVTEDADWEDDSAESSPPSPSDRVFSGEMKKRANNFFRHDWTTHRVELRGTKMTIYKSPSSQEVLTTIDIEDYSIVCNAPGSNKFQNGMKALKAGGSQKLKDSNGNYPFQLVPSSDAKKAGQTGKEHHFAVASREERIDWMRELMLAKAIKQKKSGAQVVINGKMV